MKHWRHWKDGGRVLETTLLVACLLAGAAVRLAFVRNEPLDLDEAESSIRALSILERGYPADQYLGLPIYENVLLTTSPDSQEYEFGNSRDSHPGMAIDKCWLPLYSIAAACEVAGIRPDVDDGRPPTVRHSAEELARRTIVPRIPSIVFAVVFLFSIYQLGRTISGGDTAWSALMASAFAQPIVWFGWRAHDYSATLALSTLTGLAVWKLTRCGRWRDSVVTGLALILLFYTHVLSFVILAGVLLVNIPFALTGHDGGRSSCSRPGSPRQESSHGCARRTSFRPRPDSDGVAAPLSFPNDFLSFFLARKAFLAPSG